MKVPAPVTFVRALVVASCVLVLLPSGAAAQQVGGGVKVGLTLGDIPQVHELIAEIENVADINSSNRVGWAGGGFLMIRWKNGFAIQPEVLYTQKGVTVTAMAGAESGKVTMKTDFIDVPVLGRFTFGKGVRVYAFGGPSFDFKVSAKIKESVLGQSAEQDVGSDIKSFEFALVVGGGLEFGPVLFEARWSEGLTNIDNSPASEANPEAKTRTFLFLAGFRF